MVLQEYHMHFGMSNTSRKSRPLGSIRQLSISSSPDSPSIKFPPLNASVKINNSHNLDHGLQGNAMMIPPPKQSPECRRSSQTETKLSSPSRSVNSSKSDQSSSSNYLIEIGKLKSDIRECSTKEKELKQQISLIQKLNGELTRQINEKDKLISELEQQFLQQETRYKEMYEQETQDHESTKSQLTSTKHKLSTKIEEFNEITQKYDATLSEMKTEHDKQLNLLKKEKEEEISIRDFKLNKLKGQMAEALKGNSWERQQQLDELSKELTKAQDEADMLRLKLKSISKSGSKGNGCSNCGTLTTRLAMTQKSLADRDKLLKKFEKQLTQQDVLLKQFAGTKGQNVSLLPK